MNFVAPFTAAYVAIATAIAGLSGWYGEATSKVKLMSNNPAIDSNTIIASFTEAVFDGYASLGASAVSALYSDPLTGQELIRIAPPAGGWKYATTGTTGLPLTIYGAYLTNSAGDKLLGAVKFDAPIVLTATGQLIDLGNVELFVSPTILGS